MVNLKKQQWIGNLINLGSKVMKRHYIDFNVYYVD